jgi:hypothetical protein
MLAPPAMAQNSVCEGSDSITPLLSLCKPAVDVEGALIFWGDKLNNDMDLIDASLGNVAITTGSLQAQVAALSVSTQSLAVNIATETAARIAGDVAIGASTQSLGVSIAGFGSSTASLAVSITALGASTAALSLNITTETAARIAADLALGASTQTLYNNRASSGTNADISAFTSPISFQAAGASTYSVTTSSGINILSGCIRFGTGNVQCDAVVASSAAASLTGNQTLTGVNSFSTFTYQAAAGLGINGVAMDTGAFSGVGFVSAWSVDGAVQSSGCVVSLNWSTSLNRLTATSTTTTQSGNGNVGILYEGCAPSTVCRVITRGIVQYVGQGGGTPNRIEPSTVRCVSDSNSASQSDAKSYVTTGANGANFNYIGMMVGP